MFWAAFDAPNTERSIEKSVQLFFKELLTALIDVLDVAKELRVPNQSLINTLNFMQFFMNVKIDANVQKQLKRWQDSKAKYSRICPQGDEVMRLLTKRLVDGDAALDTLIVQCTTLHSMEDFVRLTDIMSYPTVTDDDNRGTGEMAFNYAHVCAWVGHSSERQRALFDSLLLKMRTLPQQMKMSPKLSELALLASLHMLRQLLAAAPFADAAYAQSLVPALEQFLLWPQPCGAAAHAVLTALRREALAPGHTLQSRAESERAMLAVRVPCSSSSSSSSDDASASGGASTERRYPLFYFMDAGSPEAAHWSVHLQLPRIDALVGALSDAAFASTPADGDDLSDAQRAAMKEHPWAALYDARPRALSCAQLRQQCAQMLLADGVTVGSDPAAMRAALRRLTPRALAAAHARLAAATHASLEAASATTEEAKAVRAVEFAAVAEAIAAPAADDVVAGAIDPSEEQPVSAEELDARDEALAHAGMLHVGFPIQVWCGQMPGQPMAPTIAG